MKYLSILLISIAFMSCNAQSSSPSVDTNTETASTVYEILAPQAFTTKMAGKSDAHLIDVRTPEEFANGAIPNAQNINFYDDNFKTQMQALDNSKPIFLYCAKGGRSGKASTICEELGFKEIYDLKGGYTDYAAQ